MKQIGVPTNWEVVGGSPASWNASSNWVTKQKSTYTNRAVKLSISHKDYNCFEPMGFAHVRFSPFDSSDNSFKNLTCAKTRISENPIKPNKISSFFIVFQNTKKHIYEQKSEIINFVQGFPLF